MTAPVVLVVDDDGDIREALRDVLEDSGYLVHTAADGREALVVLRREPHVSLILLDIMMPVMDGWEFRAEQVHDAAIADIPVVVITAVGDADEKARAMAAAGALRKPVRLKDLLAAVAAFGSAPPP
jgi:CheY-like chemotaxis protein